MEERRRLCRLKSLRWDEAREGGDGGGGETGAGRKSDAVMAAAKAG